MWQAWTVIAVACLILELMNGDFFIMCFAIGGACSAIAAAMGAGIYWHLGIFALCSVLSLFFVRPAALRYLHKNESERVSNADAIIGREGRVVETIEVGGFGRVAIDGDVWKAVTEEDADIRIGQKVTVVSRESTIITVKSLT